MGCRKQMGCARVCNIQCVWGVDMETTNINAQWYVLYGCGGGGGLARSGAGKERSEVAELFINCFPYLFVCNILCVPVVGVGLGVCEFGCHRTFSSHADVHVGGVCVCVCIYFSCPSLFSVRGAV